MLKEQASKLICLSDHVEEKVLKYKLMTFNLLLQSSTMISFGFISNKILTPDASGAPITNLTAIM